MATPAPRPSRGRRLRLLRDQRGQTFTEYLMILGQMTAIVLVLFAGLYADGVKLATKEWANWVICAVSMTGTVCDPNPPFPGPTSGPGPTPFPSPPPPPPPPLIRCPIGVWRCPNGLSWIRCGHIPEKYRCPPPGLESSVPPQYSCCYQGGCALCG